MITRVNNEIIYTPLAGAREVQDGIEGIDGSSCKKQHLEIRTSKRSAPATPGKGSTDVDDAPAPSCSSLSKI